MKIIKKYYFVTLFLILILSFSIAGCSGVAGKNKNAANVENAKVSTNPDGIIMEISVGTSDRIDWKTAATITGKIKNVGSVDVDSGNTIIGRLQSCSAITSLSDGPTFKSEEFDSEEITKNNGMYKEIILDGLLASTVEKECTIIGDVCYTYSTELIQNIIITTDKQEYNNIVAQGSPLNVKGIIQDVSPVDTERKKLKFEIYIKKKESTKGVVINKNNYAEICSESPVEDISILNVYDAEVKLGGTPLKCYENDKETNQFKLKFFDGKEQTELNRITCSIIVSPNDSADNYPTEGLKKARQLVIKLNYGYYYQISKNIEVVKT